MNRTLGIIFSVCDGERGDERHFDRFEAELERLQYPFAVNFDHCSSSTVKRFKRHPLCCGSYRNDNPDEYFDESHRQQALEVLLDHGFEWMLQLDVDETLEKEAPRKIAEYLTLGADIIHARVLDLWLDDKHYRVDGPFKYSGREKLFNLQVDSGIHYYHPTVHAPKIKPRGREAVLIKRPDFRVLHWGLMTPEDIEFHCKRWDEIYTRKVGANPYGSYIYFRDPNTVVQVAPVPEDV